MLNFSNLTEELRNVNLLFDLHKYNGDVRKLDNRYFADNIDNNVEKAARKLNLGDEYVKSVENYDKQFKMIKRIVNLILEKPYYKGCLIQGGPGIGKSFTLKEEVEKYKKSHPDFTYDGPAKASQKVLYSTAFKCRRPGDLAIFDDCDSAFDNESSANILKHMCDTTGDDEIQYATQPVNLAPDTDISEGPYDNWSEQDQAMFAKGYCPRRFIFKGKVIILTNTIISDLASTNPHADAIVSRLAPLTLTLTDKDKVFKGISLLLTDKKHFPNEEAAKKVVQYIINNFDVFVTPRYTFRLNLTMYHYIQDLDEEDFETFMRSQEYLNW